MEFLNQLRKDFDSGNVNSALQKIIAILASIATIVGLVAGIATNITQGPKSKIGNEISGVVSTGAKYLKGHSITDFGGMQYFSSVPMNGKSYEYSLSDRSSLYDEIYTVFRIGKKYRYLEATLGNDDRSGASNTYTEYVFIVDGTETLREKVSSGQLVKVKVPLVVDGSKGQSLKIILRSFHADSNEIDAKINGATVGTPTLFP